MVVENGYLELYFPKYCVIDRFLEKYFPSFAEVSKGLLVLANVIHHIS